jgi:hypothetical protein
MSANSWNHRILQAWEQGLRASPARRGAVLLSVLDPDHDPSNWQSLGERDRSLLLVRRRLFGAEYEGISECASCGQRVEFEFDLESLIAISELPAKSEFETRIDDYHCQVRLLTADDLELAATAGSPDQIRQALLRRCLISIRHGPTETDPADLPLSVIDAISQMMASSDPLADVRFNLNCPACGQSWRPRFDALACLWTEIEATALRVLREVHVLAATYHWGQDEILSLADGRRQAYLDLIRA